MFYSSMMVTKTCAIDESKPMDPKAESMCNIYYGP